MSIRNWPTRLLLVLCFTIFVSSAYAARGDRNNTLNDVRPRHWDESHVRRVLAAFAYGGLASDAQIDTWSRMRPRHAVAEILTFDSVNNKLSPPEAGDDTSLHCGSLASLQAFWSSDDPYNMMKYGDRSRYAVLNANNRLSTSNLQRTWVKAISTRGCNPFLHKMALYITNYHASISVEKTRAGLIRDYYDRIAAALSNSGDFIDVMTVAATDAALARAYGHRLSKYYNRTEVFKGTDDFAREFHQLLFRINGTTENTVYHEDTTIEHTAWMLTGMNVDRNQGAYGSPDKVDWYIGPIDFSDHYDDYTKPRNLRNTSLHYHGNTGEDSCLEILHSTICGDNAGEKIAELARVAAEHSESMANVPVTIIDFFADDNLDANKIKAIRGTWAEADYNLLKFIRKYAASTAFHNTNTFKYRTAFDRNLLVQNKNTLDNEEAFGRDLFDSPFARMRDQGAVIFDPAHDVFGGQTGFQAANNRYLFRDAYWSNVAKSTFLLDISDTYTLDPGVDAAVYKWQKDWGSVIPVNANGEYVVADVAEWLWNHFIGDGGKNFDPIARAQVHALLADNRDFAYVVDPSNPDVAYSSDEIVNGAASATDQALAAETMNFNQNTANIRVGMAINFITMTPYAFVMEGK
ncbi:MAG: DUF1800 family protein [Xanthomonadales bacterium]|nr:DUF1800 family protein [Xanthomonadales bacterium]